MTKKAGSPSLEQIADARRLKQAWERRQSEDATITQDFLAEKLEVTQGAISHFMNGRRALSMPRLMQFCALLRARPGDISPRLAAQVEAGLSAQPHAAENEPEYVANSAAERDLLRYIREHARDSAHRDRIARTALILLRTFVENAVPDELLELNGWNAKNKEKPHGRR